MQRKTEIRKLIEDWVTPSTAEAMGGLDELVEAISKLPLQGAAERAVPAELVMFTDQSTADPIEKARRYLKAMADHRINSVYQFDDGYPKQAAADDAAATLAVLEQLAASPAQPAPEPSAQQRTEP